MARRRKSLSMSPIDDGDSTEVASAASDSTRDSASLGTSGGGAGSTSNTTPATSVMGDAALYGAKRSAGQMTRKQSQAEITTVSDSEKEDNETEEDEQPRKKSRRTSNATIASAASARSTPGTSTRASRQTPEVVIYRKASATRNRQGAVSVKYENVLASSPLAGTFGTEQSRKAEVSSSSKGKIAYAKKEESDSDDLSAIDDAILKSMLHAEEIDELDSSSEEEALQKKRASNSAKGKGKAKAAPAIKGKKPAASETAKGKGSAKKGKGKAVAESSDESEYRDEDDSDITGLALTLSEDSDLSDVDDEGHTGKVETAIGGSTTLRRARAARTRKNKGDEKLNWWQKNERALAQHHPELRTVWDDLRQMPIVPATKAEQPPGLSLKLLPFQQEGLYWMKKQEKGHWKGGMLADEMGMGKTIQTIALILTDYDASKHTNTLILAPTVAIMQWRNEFNKFTSGLKVCVWHGGNRSNSMKDLVKYDIVLTSYAVLESSFRRQNTGFKRKGELCKEDSILHQIDWHRVILDEAHNIKDRSCNTARGAFALKANFRWCLSGTPLQNRVGELYSLIRFLGAEPFSFYYCKKCPCRSLHWKFSNKRHCDECGHTPMHHICYWNNEVLKPIQKYGATLGGHGSLAFKKLSLLLARMMLRRTKVERADDMGLPPRDISVRRDYFTEEEEEFYSSLYMDVKRKFSSYVAQDSLLNNYANVFQLLTRMRQTACHPDMVLKGRAAKALLGEAGAQADLSISTCRLCLDEGDDPIMSACKHVYCRECIRQYLETAVEAEPECPVCHLPLSIDLQQEVNEQLLNARQGMLAKIDPGKWRTSTKIEALVEELTKLKTEDHSIKSLVFSQFTSFLDLIARRLQLAGFKIARLQGNMTPEARDRTVKYFMNTTDCTVFLLSLKAGGVALNLTEASRVFIMDPWWNPSAELQAADRVHRIGQHRPIKVTRLIIENSIESKIVELQKKKELMIGAALGEDDSALGRLTPEDLAFLFVM